LWKVLWRTKGRWGKNKGRKGGMPFGKLKLKIGRIEMA
jgi:hypothetical protein